MPRIEFPGAIHHVMRSGNREEDIFADDDDRCKYPSYLGEACNKTGWLVLKAEGARIQANTNHNTRTPEL